MSGSILWARSGDDRGKAGHQQDCEFGTFARRESASAIPSITGMRTSVRSRSKIGVLAYEQIEGSFAVAGSLDLVPLGSQRARHQRAECVFEVFDYENARHSHQGFMATTSRQIDKTEDDVHARPPAATQDGRGRSPPDREAMTYELRSRSKSRFPDRPRRGRQI